MQKTIQTSGNKKAEEFFLLLFYCTKPENYILALSSLPALKRATFFALIFITAPV